MAVTSIAPVADATLDAHELARMDAYWRAANYLSVGQIYLKDNPLLKEPLQLEHVKPRLLGHWGTTPGLNFIYLHLNRAIRQRDLDMIYITGPGHGGPGLVANTYLEGTYSEIYPDVSEDADGMRRLFKQFSFPGGVPSHVAAEVPGSIHEGGELGYALSHAFGAAFDNPDLVAACVIGDGEAETGPLAASWHSNKFLDPVGDGAVLPILHLNGYKISNPSVLARIEPEELESLLVGYGWKPYFVEGSDPELVHRQMAETLDAALDEIAEIQAEARASGISHRPRWPMIVLRTPKGWTGPQEVDGLKTEDHSRSHQVPLAALASRPDHLEALEAWMRSYRPEELFDADGRLVPELRALAPEGEKRMGANPHANGGKLLRNLRMPDFRAFAVDVPAPGATTGEATRVLGGFLNEVMRRNLGERNFRLFAPDENASNRLQDRLRHDRQDVAGARAARRRGPGGRRARDGDPLRAHLPGLAGGLPADRPPRAVLVLRGVHPHHRLDVQPAREVAEDHARARLAHADRVAQLPPDLARLAPGPQRLLPPGPRLHRPRRQQEGRHRAGLAAAGRQHAAGGRRPVPAQPRPRERDRRGQAARAAVPRHELRDRHCTKGVGIWDWASNDRDAEPDVVMACAGDVPTLETLAAVDILRREAPELRVRVVNVVDLMTLQPQSEHPHGLSDREFDAIFTPDKPIMFAYHGYPWLIHRLTYRRTNHANLHVRGYKEEGTTTTPFDMCVMNDIDRYSLVCDALDRVPRLGHAAVYVRHAMRDKHIEHKQYVHEHGIDMPEVLEWTWPTAER